MQSTRATLSVITFAYLGLCFMLTYFVATPVAAAATGDAGVMPWIVSIGCALAGIGIAFVGRGTTSGDRYKSTYVMALSTIELGLLLGVFVFMQKGYPLWAPAAIAIPAIILVWILGVLL